MIMPENTDVFPDVETAANELVEYAAGFTFPCADTDLSSVVRASAESAWLKTLTRKKAGSVELYDRWAGANVPKMAKSVRYVINQEQYDILVRRTGRDLLRAWREGTPDRTSRLSFGAAYRIVDLLFMAIDESENCRYEAARQYLHVPLDGSTLRPLRLIVGELIDSDFAVEIPATIPSGYIATEEHYVLLQAAISALAYRAGIPPILYAYWCARP